jgi:hypothetical protein
MYPSLFPHHPPAIAELGYNSRAPEALPFISFTAALVAHHLHNIARREEKE